VVLFKANVNDNKFFIFPLVISSVKGLFLCSKNLKELVWRLYRGPYIFIVRAKIIKSEIVKIIKKMFYNHVKK